MLGNTEGKKRRQWERMRWLDGITCIDSSISAEDPGSLEPLGSSEETDKPTRREQSGAVEARLLPPAASEPAC